jgi:hypothetical protein
MAHSTVGAIRLYGTTCMLADLTGTAIELAPAVRSRLASRQKKGGVGNADLEI